MFGKKEKKAKENPREPRLVVIKEREQDKYICPGCKEETLTYNEEEGLFICRNEKCKAKFALIKVE